ncbi:MAG: glycosyltransferase family 9 protein [Ignavibacteria bacterium]
MIEKGNIKNILIIRTDRLGDVLLTLPLITAAKKVFTDPKISFFVKEYVSGLIEGYMGIDQLIIEENIKSFDDKYRFFKKHKPDLVITVKPRFDLALLFYLLHVKYRIGTGYRWYSFLYNYKVHEHRKVSDKHESEYNLNLLKHFFEEAGESKEFYFKYSGDEKNNLYEKLQRYGISKEDRYIIIHPGSGSSAKDLPPEKFTEYTNKFFRTFKNYKIIFTGIEIERSLIKSIIDRIGKNNADKIFDLSGQLNLRELMILIDNSELFISNSTGPVHIAGAMNKKIIGFYPNSKPMNDTRWKPLSEHSIIFKPASEDDMSTIVIDDVILATSRLLS